ncbi:hypothetical protein QR680_018355 [Steinernema hermaphroditum]|nr:hypothetical protein QR680_018355 [Steinernema hermaphroditum]
MEMTTKDESSMKCAIDVVQENVEHGGAALEEQELVEHDAEPIAPIEMEMATADESNAVKERRIEQPIAKDAGKKLGGKLKKAALYASSIVDPREWVLAFY